MKKLIKGNLNHCCIKIGLFSIKNVCDDNIGKAFLPFIVIRIEVAIFSRMTRNVENRSERDTYKKIIDIRTK